MNITFNTTIEYPFKYQTSLPPYINGKKCSFCSDSAHVCHLKRKLDNKIEIDEIQYYECKYHRDIQGLKDDFNHIKQLVDRNESCPDWAKEMYWDIKSGKLKEPSLPSKEEWPSWNEEMDKKYSSKAKECANDIFKAIINKIEDNTNKST